MRPDPQETPASDSAPASEKHFPVWARLLLLVPFAALLYPPLYNALEPRLWGFPFFYWYQLAWVPLTALLTYVAYRSVR